jgi:hypothetical protein
MMAFPVDLKVAPARYNLDETRATAYESLSARVAPLVLKALSMVDDLIAGSKEGVPLMLMAVHNTLVDCELELCKAQAPAVEEATAEAAPGAVTAKSSADEKAPAAEEAPAEFTAMVRTQEELNSLCKDYVRDYYEQLEKVKWRRSALDEAQRMYDAARAHAEFIRQRFLAVDAKRERAIGWELSDEPPKRRRADNSKATGSSAP